MCLCQSANQEQRLMLSACPEHARQSAVWSMKLTNVSTVQLETLWGGALCLLTVVPVGECTLTHHVLRLNIYSTGLSLILPWATCCKSSLSCQPLQCKWRKVPCMWIISHMWYAPQQLSGRLLQHSQADLQQCCAALIRKLPRVHYCLHVGCWWHNLKELFMLS